MNSSDHDETARYTVHQDGLTEGPFNISFIEAMIMSGVYSASILVQLEGESETFRWDQRSSPPEPLPISVDVYQNRGIPAFSHQSVPTSGRPVPTGSLHAGVDPVESPQNPTRPIGGETVFAWIVGVFAVFVLFWVFANLVDQKSKTESGLGNVSRASVSPQARPTPTQRPRISESIYSPPPPSHLASSIVSPSSFAQPPPAVQPIPTSPTTPKADVDTQLYRDAYGRTYRVPNSAYGRLLSMKSALEEQKRRLDQREEEVDTLRRQIDRARLYLDRTSQYAIDSFNRDVSRLNAMIEALQPAVDGFNRGVDSFNAELARVGTLIR